MIIGMLWSSSNKDIKKDISESKKYYINKYRREPDTVEVNPLFAEASGIDGNFRSYDGLNIRRSKNIQYGCLLIGVEKDTDNSKYIEGK